VKHDATVELCDSPRTSTAGLNPFHSSRAARPAIVNPPSEIRSRLAISARTRVQDTGDWKRVAMTDPSQVVLWLAVWPSRVPRRVQAVCQRCVQ
jgi:hypothetical protein